MVPSSTYTLKVTRRLSTSHSTESHPFRLKGTGGDRLAGRLEDGSGEGIPVSVGEELRRPARRRG